MQTRAETIDFDTFFQEEGKKKNENKKVVLRLGFETKVEDKKITTQWIHQAVSNSLKSLYGELGSTRFSVGVKDLLLHKKEASVVVDYNDAREIWAALVSTSQIQDIDIRIRILGIESAKDFIERQIEE